MIIKIIIYLIILQLSEYYLKILENKCNTIFFKLLCYISYTTIFINKYFLILCLIFIRNYQKYLKLELILNYSVFIFYYIVYFGMFGVLLNDSFVQEIKETYIYATLSLILLYLKYRIIHIFI